MQVGDKVWIKNHYGIFQIEIKMMHGKSVAYFADSEIKIVELSECYERESEVYMKLSNDSFTWMAKHGTEGQNYLASYRKCLDKEKEGVVGKIKTETIK